MQLSAQDKTDKSFTAAYPAGYHAPNRAPESGFYRRGMLTRDQMRVIGKVVTENKLSDFDLSTSVDPRMGRARINPSTMSEFDDQLTAPEFILRGDSRNWDEIYAAGGLGAWADDIDTGRHVEASTHRSAYVPASRELSVAKYFAGHGLQALDAQFGYIYLLYLREGISMSAAHKHQQNEVVAFGRVPLRDILMFKWLGEPEVVYVNLEYRATSLEDLETIDYCLRMIGGGSYQHGLLACLATPYQLEPNTA